MQMAMLGFGVASPPAYEAYAKDRLLRGGGSNAVANLKSFYAISHGLAL